jgi:sugar lactone lactonase YvrE
LALVILALVSCAEPMSPGSPSAKAEPEIYMAWPKPPAPARIALIQTIARAADVGIDPTLWSRLVGWFAGNEEISLVRPTAAVMAPGEVLYVADPGIAAVHRLDMENQRHELIRRAGDLPLPSPIALALGPEGRVFVTDSELRQVLVTDNQSDTAQPLDLQHALSQPTGLAIDRRQRRLYLVDTKSHQVLVFGLDGSLRSKWGGRGTTNGRFNYPTFIWHDPDQARLWVTDSLNFRVQQFDTEGRFLDSFGQLGDTTGSFSRPKGVATDSRGHVYVMDALFHSLQIFDPAGALLLHVGEQGQDPGQFWLPTGLFIDGRDRIFVADSFNKRIQVFRYLGDET